MYSKHVDLLGITSVDVPALNLEVLIELREEISDQWFVKTVQQLDLQNRWLLGTWAIFSDGHQAMLDDILGVLLRFMQT